MKAINTISAFTSASLLFVGLYEAEWVLSFALAGTLAVCFLVEAEI